MTVPEQVTVGVAIPIPQPYAATLTAWRSKVGDRAGSRLWPHITLLPPTEVDAARLPDIERHLRCAAAESAPFDVHLSGTGTFRPVSPVVFVQVARGVSDCERLEALVRSGPLDRPTTFPYHPHVTVAQEVSDEALETAYGGLAAFAARFGVGGFDLYARGADGAWTTLCGFALAAPRP